jgi:hypothetical protein
MNYKAAIEGNSIVGVVANKEKPTFKLDFCGIRSPKEGKNISFGENNSLGFVALYKRMKEKKDPNRKYNLWDNNSNE